MQCFFSCCDVYKECFHITYCCKLDLQLPNFFFLALCSSIDFISCCSSFCVFFFSHASSFFLTLPLYSTISFLSFLLGNFMITKCVHLFFLSVLQHNFCCLKFQVLFVYVLTYSTCVPRLILRLLYKFSLQLCIFHFYNGPYNRIPLPSILTHLLLISKLFLFAHFPAQVLLRQHSCILPPSFFFSYIFCVYFQIFVD